MIDLYLHVGFGKTGSTYLQSLLYSNADLLYHQGIYYPIDCNVSNSGNGHLLDSEFIESLSICDNSISKILFSREHFTRELSGERFYPFFSTLLKSSLIGNIYVFMFVRNAFDHCYSLWSQKIKNTSETRSFREFAEQYDSLSVAAAFISTSLDYGLNLTTVNYSTTASIVLTFFNWLDPLFPTSKLFQPQCSINASPDFSYLNRIRLYRRYSSDLRIPSFFFSFIVLLRSLSIFKPRRSYFYACMWRHQIARLNFFLSCNQHSLYLDPSCSSSSSVYVSH